MVKDETVMPRALTSKADGLLFLCSGPGAAEVVKDVVTTTTEEGIARMILRSLVEINGGSAFRSVRSSVSSEVGMAERSFCSGSVGARFMYRIIGAVSAPL